MDKTRGTQSIQKAINLLDLIANNPGGLTLPEICDKSTYPKSTVHRILSALTDQDLVRFSPEMNIYRIGHQIMFYSNAYLKGFNLVGEVHPALERLNKEVGETVHLGILDDSLKQVVYIDKLDSSRVVRMFSRLGQAVPVHCTALGKAILSFLPKADLDKVLDGYKFEQFTKNTITTYDTFLQEVEQVKHQGYALDNMEHEDTIFCVGKAFRDPQSQIAAISISIPSYRSKMHTIDLLNEMLTKTINIVEESLFNRNS